MLQSEADIYLGRLTENYRFIQSQVKSAKVMAVVKADAYGHGVVPVAKSLSQAGVFGFCVAIVSEIHELLDAGICNPILHLGRISKDDLEVYTSNQIRCTINSFEDIRILENYGQTKNVRIRAHLKIDTGMGRMGVKYENVENIINVLSTVRYIEIEGVYSHFSTAEEDKTQYRDLQLDRFQEVIENIKAHLPTVKYFHIANSAAILTCTKSYFNMVRPGISLFGVSPLGKAHSSLIPVMKLKAPVAIVKNYKKGDSIGYNRHYLLKKDEAIAIAQAGYADGIPIELSKIGKVEIEGELYSIAGKISMDLIAICIDNKNIIDGQEVVFWGGSNSILRLENISNKLKKIPYEFLTGVTKRVKRNYIND